MSGKEYLSQLWVLNQKINHRQAQIDEIRSLVSSVQSPQWKEDVIQTSHSQDSMAESVVKYIDMERDIACMIDNYIDMKHAIITQIHGITNVNYMTLLYKRYVEFKRLELIALEMNYDYDWIRKMHGQAIELFEITHPEIISL